MNKIADSLLQIVFVGALVMVALTLYFTRIVNLRAGEQDLVPAVTGYEAFTSAFQFEREEQRIQTKIAILKAEYASDLIVYKQEKALIEVNEKLSDLEKREKNQILNGIYSTAYFERKLGLIDEQLAELNKLGEAKCRKYCTYQDLPAQDQ